MKLKIFSSSTRGLTEILAKLNDNGNHPRFSRMLSCSQRRVGLGDVVGALPKYQRDLGHVSKVVMPMYRTKFLRDNQFEVVHKGYTHLHNYWFNYTIIKESTNKLGFDLYLVDIFGLLDREKIYGYGDDTERFFAFQIAVVDWLAVWKHHPDVIHVHDHHCALIPFMVNIVTPTSICRG